MTDIAKNEPMPRSGSKLGRAWNFLRSIPKARKTTPPNFSRVSEYHHPNDPFNKPNSTTGSESTGPQSTARASVLHTEKPPKDYDNDNFLRENEIKFIENTLKTHPAVIIVGNMGRGKSTLLSELVQIIREKRDLLFINCHSFSTGPGANPLAAKHDFKRLADFLHAPSEVSPQTPDNYRVIILDAGDFLKFPPLYLPLSYGSDEFMRVQTIMKNPEQARHYVQNERSSSLKTKRELAAAQQRRIDAWNAQFPNSPSPERAPTEEEMIQAEINYINQSLQISTVQAATLELLDRALKSGNTKIILTDHEFPMPPERSVLEKRFDQMFEEAYRYDLPANYEVNRARIYLQRVGIQDKKLQNAIIAATEGSHQLLKYVITPEIIAQLQKVPAHKREEFLAEIIEKAPKY